MASSQESVPDLCGSEIERFLDAVQQHPCVYDTKRMDYRDAERKNNAWEQIRVYAGLSKGASMLHTCVYCQCSIRLRTCCALSACLFVLFSLFQSMSA